MTEAAEKYGKELAILATGPLTNLAIAYLLDNNFPNLIGGLTLMGGNYSGLGLNHAFSAEFNFTGDVDAAHIVIKNFKDIVIIPFELPVEAPTTNFDKCFKNDRTAKGKFIQSLFDGMFQIVCDPLVAFPFITPDVVTGVYHVYGEVVKEGFRTKGFLAIDWLNTRRVTNPNLIVVCSMDWKVVTEELALSL